MTMQEAVFTVTLCDYPGLPDPERSKAEARYARMLERKLGGCEQVNETLALVQDLEDMPPEEISDEAKQAFARWMKAARAAAEAGLQGLGESECCFFEVRRGARH